MPVYHSALIDWSGPVSCGSALLSLRTKVKGPAAPSPAGQNDIIDEAVSFFRANVLFRNFAPTSTADLTLAYLTVFIGELLRAMCKFKTKEEARKSTIALAMSTTFAVPGEKSFCLAGFFPAPASKSESDAWRAYFRQAREETWNRILDLAFISTEPFTQNKWWMAFGKRRFMNIAATG